VPYLLDGNNLIGRERGSSRASDEDREGLVREVCERLRRTRARAVVFFDGPAPRGAGSSLGSLTLRYAGKVSADAAMLEEISKSRAPREIVLVTADRELGRRAREAGASVLGPEEFWSRFGTGGAPGKETPSRVDVDEWMRYFEDERNRQPK
jgi:hypothetical protein